MKPLRFIFMGTPKFAVPALQALIEAGHEPVCIYTQPPRPSGRGQKLLESPVLKFSKHRSLSTATPISLKNPDVIQELLEKEVDVIVVIGRYDGQLIQSRSGRFIMNHRETDGG